MQSKHLGCEVNALNSSPIIDIRLGNGASKVRREPFNYVLNLTRDLCGC